MCLGTSDRDKVNGNFFPYEMYKRKTKKQKWKRRRRKQGNRKEEKRKRTKEKTYILSSLR